MISRIMESSSGLSAPSRRTVSEIRLFGEPRIRSTASLRVSPCTVLPSRARIRSPALTPARDAGVSSIGLMTLMNPLSCVTSMPRPPNSPRVCTCMSRNALAFM